MRFRDIHGNDKVVKALAGMADSSKIPHALLFFENEGCGALPLALAFYQYINCHNRHDGDSCGECPSCNRISKLIHPDLHFIYPVNTSSRVNGERKDISSRSYLPYFRQLVMANPYFLEGELYNALGIEGKAGNITINEANFLIQTLSLTSVEDGYKAALVYLPEKMNAETGNKLLKLVEEPPEKTLFFFITHAPEKMLQTIFSRCQSLRVLPCSKEDVEKVLSEQFSVAPDNARAFASVAGGSIGVALNHLGEREEYSRFMEIFADLINAALDNDLAAALDAADEIAGLDSREKQKAFCNFAGECLRKAQMIRMNLPGIANITGEEIPFFTKIASRCKVTFCEKALGIFDSAAQMIERNVSAKIVFCDLADRIFVSI